MHMLVYIVNLCRYIIDLTCYNLYAIWEVTANKYVVYTIRQWLCYLLTVINNAQAVFILTRAAFCNWYEKFVTYSPHAKNIISIKKCNTIPDSTISSH